MGGDLRSANATEEVVFTLYTSLGRSLRVAGAVIFKGWFKADSHLLGTIYFTLYEVKSGGERVVVAKVEGYGALSTRSNEYTFGTSGVDHEFSEGSTIQFSALFVPDRPGASPYLLWDTAKTPTQVIIPCVDHIGVLVTAYDGESLLKNFFSLESKYGSMNISFMANVTNPFGVQDLLGASLTVINPYGGLEAAYEPMGLKKIGAALITATYELNKTLRKGMYRAVVNVTDSAGNTFSSEETFWVTFFYSTAVRFLDNEGLALSNVNYTVVNINTGFGFSGKANETGYSIVVLPPSSVVGDYNATVLYGNWTFSTIFIVSEESEIVDVKVPLYKVEVRASFYFIPLPEATIRIVGENGFVFEGKTSRNGTCLFNRVPGGRYNIVAEYAGGLGKEDVDVEDRTNVSIQVRSLYLLIGIAAFIALVSASSVAFVVRKYRFLMGKHFSFINKLIEGGVPFTSTIMVTGPPASGKSILLGNLANQSLEKGRKSLFIVNTDFPVKVRDQLMGIGVDVKDFEKEGMIRFVDCYSGVAGQKTVERHFVDSPNDVTRLGIEISVCLEEMEKDTDVYYDSLSTVITSLKPEQVVSFVHATGAKVKGFGGRFCFTVGSEAQPEVLARIDETADCVFELRLRESDHQQIKMLRVKKMRGESHSPRWVAFEVKKKKGIVFLPRLGVS